MFHELAVDTQDNYVKIDVQSKDTILVHLKIFSLLFNWPLLRWPVDGDFVDTFAAQTLSFLLDWPAALGCWEPFWLGRKLKW